MKIIYTDGSLRKKTIGAWAYVILDEKESKILQEGAELSAEDTTISRMELEAIAQALRQIADGETVTIYSDSKYAVNSISFWIHGWSKKNWLKKDGTDVMHADLMKEFLQHKQRCKIKIFHVEAHTGVKWNEYVDGKAGGLTEKAAGKSESSGLKFKVVDQSRRTIKKSKVSKTPVMTSKVKGPINEFKAIGSEEAAKLFGIDVDDIRIAGTVNVAVPRRKPMSPTYKKPRRKKNRKQYRRK